MIATLWEPLSGAWQLGDPAQAVVWLAGTGVFPPLRLKGASCLQTLVCEPTILLTAALPAIPGMEV